MNVITLRLNNFKCFENAQVTLRPLTLLDGRSGSGKTTLLKALLFALTGKGKNCVSFGQRTCRVEARFEVDGVACRVRRSVRPNRLLLALEGESEELEDAVAQQRLDDLVGADSLLLGYVGQNDRSCLALSPGDRFKLFRDVLIDQETLAALKVNLKTMRATRQRRYDAAVGRAGAFAQVVDDTPEPGSEESPEELQAIVDALTRRIAAADQADRRREYVTTRLAALQGLRPLTEVTRERKTLVASQPFLTAWHAAGRPDVASVLVVPIVDLWRRRRDAVAARRDVDVALEAAGTACVCPRCRGDLVFRNGALFSPTATLTTADAEPLLRRRRAIERTLAELESQLDGVAEPPSCATDDVAAALYEAWPVDGVDLSLLELSPSQWTARRRALDDEAAAHVERAELLATPLPPVGSHEERAADVGRLADLERRLAAARRGQNRRAILLCRGAKIETELAAEAVARSAALTQLVCDAETLQLEAGLAHVEALLGELTMAMSDGKLRAVFCLDTAAGAQRLKIGILHDNQCETDHTTLSGGETARLAIAMAVVLATVKGVPVLILDEATSSLDEETAALTLNVVRRYYSGMVLCVAHQAVKGGFDHVVDVEALRRTRPAEASGFGN